MPIDNLDDHIPPQTIPRQAIREVRIPRNSPLFTAGNVAKLITACYAVVACVERDELTDEAKEFLASNEELWTEVTSEGFFPSLDEVADQMSSSGELDEDYLKAFQLGLRVFIKSYENYAESIHSAKAWFKNFTSYLSTRKSVYRLALDKASSDSVYPAWTEKTFAVTEVDDQEDIQDELIEIVSEWNGQRSLFIKSREEEKKMSEERPDLWERYVEANKKFTHSWLTYVAAFVRERGEKLASYQELLEEMEENGYESDLPAGFDGYIDAAANMYTKNKEKIMLKPRRRYNPWIIMSPDTVKSVFKVTNWKGETENIGTKNTYYTEKHHKDSSLEKFAAVRDFGDLAESIRARWLRQLTGDSSGNGNKVFAPTDVNQVAALVIELVWQTAARIGNPENQTGEEKTYGLSTVLVNQTRFNANSVTMTYKGKDAVNTKHTIKGDTNLNRYIINALKALATYGGKRGSDYLFTYVTRQGRQRRLTDSTVNKELKEFYNVPSGFSIHNIRTYHGTKIFEEQMERIFKKYDKLDKSQAKEVINFMAIEVGKKLNHIRRTADGDEQITPATALTNYIDYNAQAKFYEHYGVPMPAFLSKKVGRTLTASPFLESDAFEPAVDSLDDEITEKLEDEALRTDDGGIALPELSEDAGAGEELIDAEGKGHMKPEAQSEEREVPLEDPVSEDTVTESTEETSEATPEQEHEAKEESADEPVEESPPEKADAEPTAEEETTEELSPEEEQARKAKLQKEEEAEELRKSREPTPVSNLTEELLTKADGSSDVYYS